ncbi:hypothetical protein JTB14_036774 [Gonioctena quinquepunctata]|nr:hypothetical protein JTB14_036774 [Gonioctena quinquepunctata]
MNSLLEKQKKHIEEMEVKIKELKKEIAEKRVAVKTADTQTCTHHTKQQSTMTDPPFTSGVDIPILDDTLRRENLTQEDRNSTSIFVEVETANITTEIPVCVCVCE